MRSLQHEILNDLESLLREEESVEIKNSLDLANKEIIKLKKHRPSASSNSYVSFSISYNGEKNLGELGPIKEYWMDYDALRARSWQSYIESEITLTILGRYAKWVIGSGLKLQAEPVVSVLRSEKIEIDSQDFSEVVESRFSVFSKSRESDYSRMRNLHKIAKRAFINAIVGGDVLVVQRFIKGQLSTQLIDGCHVCSPMFGADYLGYQLPNGNQIKHGIEISPSGEHIAYWVKDKNYKWERIPAKAKGSDMTMAFMVYGLEYRLDNCRGIPLFAVVLETLKKLERYKEATVGSAEERQKIALFFEHSRDSTGENPLGPLAKALNADADDNDDLPIDEQGRQLANTVAATTNKQAFNMPIGSTVKSVDSRNELYFKDFYTVNFNIVCACVGIPPEVASSKYDSNFSSSRAALKDWEHTLRVERNDFSQQFYQRIYENWLEIEILKNKVSAPGYLSARVQNNTMALGAYRNTRWVGDSVPHIDPEKEVNAERLKLGQSAANMPLTTLEAATEALSGGDSDSNMEQFSSELQEAKKLKIIQEQTIQTKE